MPLQVGVFTQQPLVGVFTQRSSGTVVCYFIHQESNQHLACLIYEDFASVAACFGSQCQLIISSGSILKTTTG